jgi:hypothetical protein
MFKLHLHMKSGGQIDGQMSQSPVVWWYREVVGMCVEAVPVLGAESADFLFYRCDLKILLEDHGASVITRRTFPWKRSSISMLEMEAEAKRCIA